MNIEKTTIKVELMLTENFNKHCFSVEEVYQHKILDTERIERQRIIQAQLKGLCQESIESVRKV